MKYFKTEASHLAPRYEITSKNFEVHTGRLQPFEQSNESGGLSAYGICPSCLNPILLKGIEREIKVRPHGAHAGKYIKGLPVWNQQKYEYCPFAKRKDYREPNEKDLLEIDDGVIELYNLLKNQFDRVVYILSHEFEVKFSTRFWRVALTQYLKSHVYCYPWLTEANLPYVFAYRGMQQQNIWGEKFLVGSELYNAIVIHPNVNFVEPSKTDDNISDRIYARLDNKDSFLMLQFRFTNHRQKATDGETLCESMDFYVDDLISGDILYKRTIEFSETYFVNLINKIDNEKNRQQWLLDIATELMPEIN